jgi:uncharacterized membrane protein YfcA
VSPLLLVLGLLIGVSLGALGGGGSILTVPALVYLVGQPPQDATTSSLLIVGTASLVAIVPHARRGNVRLGQGLTFGALGIVGSSVGSAASGLVPPAVLLTGFAALMLIVAALMARRSRDRKPPEPPANATHEPLIAFHPFRCACPRVATVLATATAVGLLTGFFGVGGGFALVPALVLAMSFPMPVAVGTSLLVIAINSATALAARSAGGMHIDWPVIGIFAAAASAGTLLGSRLVTKIAPHHLTRAFAVLLTAVAVYTASRSIPALA